MADVTVVPTESLGYSAAVTSETLYAISRAIERARSNGLAST